MINLIRILGIYLCLSAQGKKLFRRLYRMLKDAKGLSHYRSLLSSIGDTMNASYRRWFTCIKASDAGFVDFIPAWYISDSVLKPEQLYYRFFKMGAILLYEHMSLFAAYNLHPDFKAQKRCVLLGFLKRVYDDLIDNEKIDKNVLFDLEPRQELMDKADYRLLLYFRQKVRELARPQAFPNYYALLKQVSEAQGPALEPLSEEAKKVPYKIKNGFLMDMYIMHNDLPEALVKAMDVTAEFFAYLDDFYDLQEDLDKGEFTDINQSPLPQAVLEEKFRQTSDYLLKNSPNPQGYLWGLNNLMQNVLFTRRNNLSKLSRYI